MASSDNKVSGGAPSHASITPDTPAVTLDCLSDSTWLQLKALGLDQTLQQIHESERRFRRLFEFGPVAFHELDQEGIVRRVNEAECRLLGVEAGSIIGRSVFEFISLGEQSQSREAFKRKLSGQQPLTPFLREYVRRDGTRVVVEIHDALIRDQSGAAIGIYSALLDVTGKEEAQRALKDSENRYRALFEGLPSPVFVCDSESLRFLAVNEAAVLQYGYASEEFHSMTLWDIQPRENLPALLQNLGRTGSALDRFGVWKHRKKDGTFFQVDITSCAVPYGDQTATLFVASDVTELKQAEAELARKAKELARSNAELEQFAYVASHDLQEPLRMVSSYTQLLARRYGGQLDADADEFIGFAVDGAARMQNLIHDLLAFSRVTTKGHELKPADAEAALSQALLNLKAAVEDSDAAVTSDPLPRVMADSGQLVQLFQNLVGNAIKFRREEPPRIHVSAEQGTGEFVFSVRDNGIGIQPQHLERIFVIFQRLHAGAEFPGTGIGLALCKKIVERHGGRLWASSEPGAGSVFYFTIPIKDH